MFTKIKKYYQSAFRKEIESPYNLAFYKLFSKALGIIYTCRNFIKIVESKRRLSLIRTVISEKNKCAFVFANGPSLKDIDLKKIKKLIDSGCYDLISVNSFLSKSSEEILPTFAVFADNLHFSKSDKNSQYLEDISVCKKNMIPYFVPLQYFDKKSSIQIGYNSFCNIFAKNTDNIFYPPGFYGVTAFHALRIAKHLGYKKIYICGFDNSYFRDYEVKMNGDMIIRHKHYYDINDINVEVPCLYGNSSEFFFDTYRHFRYIEKIVENNRSLFNIAKETYISVIKRDISLDVYN